MSDIKSMLFSCQVASCFSLQTYPLSSIVVKSISNKNVFETMKYGTKWHHVDLLFDFVQVHVHRRQGHTTGIELLAELAILMSFDFSSCREHIIPLLKIIFEIQLLFLH